MKENLIYSINGPVVKVKDTDAFSMLEMVYVGNSKLMGEVISITKEFTTIQVYETTTGLKPGEPVFPTGQPISVTLGPGILRNIYDGIERPLEEIAKESGAFIPTGSAVEPLDTKKLWDVTLTVKVGDHVEGGTVYAKIPETDMIEHRCMVMPGMSGTVTEVKENGQYTINDVVMVFTDDEGVAHECTLTQKWPIKTPRPVNKRLPISMPLVTGQRVIDTLFPIAKGGTAAIPGGFGTGKTMTQHQLAKWCDADIIVYVGCGERGNEMTQVLEEFRELVDPKSGKPLVDRTVLIANTSNMPVAAREASIYTGITIAEYFRDMGYSVSIMADSTSRWAEALREMSGRLEEMPGDEGYPAYLGSRLAEYYERAGRVICLGKDGREGAVTAIGAVSPPGGDISEPVTQSTLRIVKVFWGLDAQLAYKRHFPAINWLSSYSLYADTVDAYFNREVAPDWSELRMEAMALLQEEASLEEIVRLIGIDALSAQDRLKLEVAKSIREDYLQQNSFHEVDTYTSLEKQYRMLKLVILFKKEAERALEAGVYLNDILNLEVRDKVARAKYIEEKNISRTDEIAVEVKSAIDELISKGGVLNA